MTFKYMSTVPAGQTTAVEIPRIHRFSGNFASKCLSYSSIEKNDFNYPFFSKDFTQGSEKNNLKIFTTS